MADNVNITAGTGTPIATDDVSGVHYQRVKLVTAEDAASEPIGDTDKGSSRALWVDPRFYMVAQSQNSSGLTTATTAYSIGDTLGTGWTFTNMARENGGSGRITGIILLDKSDIVDSVDLFFSDTSVTFGTDNAGPSISDTDAENIQGFARVGNLMDVGGARLLAATPGIAMPYVCASGATSLYVYARTLVAHTFFGAATDLRLKLIYEVN